MRYLHFDITEKIIKCFYNVYYELGPGFLESVYEKALLIELIDFGLRCEAQKAIKVKYKGNVIGNFIADITVEDKIIIEIKAIEKLIPKHEAQIINYLKATGIKLGLLVNFGNELEFKSRIF